MKPRKPLSVKPIAALLAGLGAWALAAGPAPAGTGWRELGKADFPAHVKKIVFSKETFLDGRHWVGWGKWKVSFGNPQAVAKRFWDDVGGGSVHVYLSCQNPVVGKVDCHFLLFQRPPPSGTGCFLVVPRHISLTIDCPAELRMN